MKRCPKCGAQFDESFAFCGKCGTKLESVGIDLRKKDGNSSSKTEDPAGDSLLDSAQASYEAGKYSDCVRQLEKAIKSGELGAKRLYGCFLDDSEDFRRAVERYYYSDRIIQQSSSSARTRQTQAYFGLFRKKRTAIICSALLVLGAGIGVWWASYHSPENCFKRGQEALLQKRYEDAADAFRQAAEKGHAEAQNELGICYYNGCGVKENKAEAAKWVRKAAEQGHAEAQYNLGLCYENGWGVEKNATEAEKWYKLAAEQGNEDAKKRLGFLPSLGRLIGL